MEIYGNTYAPIVLFVYNRLDHTRKTVQALQKNDLAIDSDLFIYSDAPKDNSGTKLLVEEVREYIRSINGFKTITIIENEQNKGLAGSIISGVTDIVNRYGKVIVIEDDLETSPCLLKYFNDALNYYKNDEQVMQISGHMFDVSLCAEEDAVFMPFTTSWGWATWRRAWNCFDPEMKGYNTIKNDSELKFRFDLKGSYGYFKMLEKQLEGEIDSWAIRWYLSVFLMNGLTLFPIESLVRNLGFDGSGTHCSASSRNLYLTPLFEKEITCFPNVQINHDAYEKVRYFLSTGNKYSESSKLAFVKKNFHNVVKKYFPFIFLEDH